MTAAIGQSVDVATASAVTSHASAAPSSTTTPASAWVDRS